LKLKTLSVCLVLIVTVSCKKKHNVIIQAEDYINGDGSAYAGMAFSIAQSRPAWNQDKVTNVYQGVLDENGHAAFDLKMHKDWSYILSINQPDGICHGGVTFHYLENEDNNLVNFNYAKCSYLKFSIENTSCIDTEDKIVYRRDWLTGNEIGPSVTQMGCFQFEGDYFEIPAGQYSYDWEVTKNSVTNYFDTTFTVGAGDSLTYLLEY